MTDKDEIKSIIVKSLETAENYDIAVVYDNIVSCGDCPFWHDCRKERTCLQPCAEYIFKKLEGIE